jgi:histidinol phosphatase-like enzyme
VEDAQLNVVQRMLGRHGRLLGPDELREAARHDPGALTPGALFRHRRELEPPEPSEGFARVDAVAFERRRRPDYDGRALIFWYDGVVRKSRSGARSPVSPDDVELLPGARDALRRHLAEGGRAVGVSWQPEIATGRTSADAVEAVFARTHALLGAEIEHLYCPHPDGPPVCWCRKPLPGLGAVLIERHRLDPSACVYVGRDASDEAFARALGFAYRHRDEAFR